MDTIIRRAAEKDAAKLYALNELFNGEGSTTLDN